MPRLLSNHGLHEERSFSLYPGLNRVGRNAGFEVEVLDRSISRDHARIEVRDDGAVVVDNDSRNGTFVNDVRVTRQRLAPGDRLRFGEVTFTFADDPEPLMVAALPWENNSLSHDSVESILSTGPITEETALNLGTLGRASRVEAKLKILLRVSEALSSPGDLDTILGRILGLLFRTLDIDRGVLLIVDRDSGELRPRVQRSRLPVGDNEKLYSSTIVNHVRELGTPALFANPQEDFRLPPTRSIVGQAIHASMGAPLRARGRTFGVVYVDNLTTPNRFAEEDLEFLGAFANQAAIAIDNAELYRRIESDAVLRHNLSRFFPPTALGRFSHLTDLAVMDADVTALFCDISDFTGLASRLAPREVVELLNVYFPTMAEVVFRHEGTLEKYIGDALLAVWGAPVPYEDHADRAVAAAFDMQRAVVKVNTALAPRGVAVAVHIGLHSGVVAAGNIGSEGYLQYATIGDTTNVASRVSGEAARGEIVVSSETAARLTPGRWRQELLGPRAVKGKKVPIDLVRLSET